MKGKVYAAILGISFLVLVWFQDYEVAKWIISFICGWQVGHWISILWWGQDD